MLRICVICEGQTEETFIRDVIAPIFARNDVYMGARMVQTSSGYKGGSLNYDRVRPFIINTLSEDKRLFVTTFFDLYALDKRFPQFEESNRIHDVYQRVELLEQALGDDIAMEHQRLGRNFIPYIQPYEFEGLLFTDIAKLTELEPEWKKASPVLQAMRAAAESPEHINDSYENKPSARLGKHLSQPNYHKPVHGPLAIESIGIDRLCAECKHFESWYDHLLALMVLHKL